jgi:hypothetical protein
MLTWLRHQKKHMEEKKEKRHQERDETKDIERLMHLSPRGARQYRGHIRKALNKKPGEVLTLKEFCDNSPFERNDVIPYLLD